MPPFIGIPSGWEEGIAWVASLPDPDWIAFFFEDISIPTNGDHYTISKHDWRIIPD